MAGEEEKMEAEPKGEAAAEVAEVTHAGAGADSGGGEGEVEVEGDANQGGGNGNDADGGIVNQEGGDDSNPDGGGGKQHRGQPQRYQRRHQPYGRGGGGGNFNVGGGYGGGGGGGSRAVYQHEQPGSDRSRRVYVGNLSWQTTWQDLKDHMKTTGCEVTRADVLCSPDGRSKGCGIVEFETAEGAQRAVLTLNDTELLGRQVFVREDREAGSGGGYYTQQMGGGVSGGGGVGGGGGSYNNGGGDESRQYTAGGGDAQTRRVYVGNLSWDVAWQDLKDHMRNAGEAVFAEVMREHDGRSKGCGIVEFATAAEAEEAINTLTDTELKGRMIFVREDREIAPGGNGGGVGGGGGAVFGGYQGQGGRGGGGDGTSVYVGNLSYETSWQDLKDHMRKAGNVDQANVLQESDGRSKGCGIVRYQRPQEAARAIRELQNSMLTGRPIFVRMDREQGGGGGGSHQYHGGGGGSGLGQQSRAAPGCQLWVRNLSWDTSWRELKDHFRQCGDVERAEVIEGPDGQSRGFGTVRFYRTSDAANAIEHLNGVELQGRELDVKIDAKA